MNDFTKEELKIIAINLCINEKTLKVLEKLQSMIQNYSHTRTFPSTYITNSGSGSSASYMKEIILRRASRDKNKNE
jgi:glutaredoxin-related protein